jgi:hypothetical protein
MANLGASTRLYRILRFEHAVSLLTTRALRLSSPAVWSDPYEVKFDDSILESLFAQCWSTTPTSDAMWRIYSPDFTSVRISVRVGALGKAMRSALPLGSKYTISPVEYMSSPRLDRRLLSLTTQLRERFSTERMLDTMLWKRAAFAHEAEVRLVVHLPETPSTVRHFDVLVDPHKLVLDIVLDPRAPQEIAGALAHYLKNHTRFNGPIEQSDLYASIKTTRVRDVTFD